MMKRLLPLLLVGLVGLFPATARGLRPPPPPPKPEPAERKVGILFLPDDRILVSRWAETKDGRVLGSYNRLTDLRPGRLRSLNPSPPRGRVVAVLAGGRLFVAGHDQLSLWGIEAQMQLRVAGTEGEIVLGATASPDGKRAITAHRGGRLVCWELPTLTKGDDFGRGDPSAKPIDALFFLPDSGHLLAGSPDGITLWDVPAGKADRTFADSAGHRLLALSENGKLALSTRDDGNADKKFSLFVWDVTTGKPVRHFPAHSDRIKGAGFSPDGKTILTGGDQTLRAWKRESGEMVWSVEVTGYRDWVEAVAFSPDGRWIVASTENGTTLVRDARNGRLLRLLEVRTDGKDAPVLFAELKKRLKDDRVSVRVAAVEDLPPLSWTGGADVHAMHQAALKDPEPRVRLAAALGRIDRRQEMLEESDRVIVALWWEKDAAVRREAAEGFVAQAIRHRPPQSAALRLSEALKHPDPTVRIAAAVGLRQIDRKAFGYTELFPRDAEKIDPCIRLVAVETHWLYGDLDKQVAARVHAAYALMKDPDEAVRLRATRIIGGPGPFERTTPAAPPDAALRTLTELLDDKQPLVRMYAAGCLVRRGQTPERLVPALLSVLAEPNLPESEVAAQALGSLGTRAKAAIPTLIERLKQGDRRSALILGQIGPDAIPALLKVLRGQNLDARRLAVDPALTVMYGAAKPALPELSRLLLDADGPDPMLRLLIARQLGEMGPAAAEAVPALIMIAGNDREDGNLRATAICNLGQLGPAAKEAVPILKPLRDHPHLGYDAKQAIEKITANPVPK